MQVYLEGELERGIVPLESAWMHGRGSAEDGCLLLLQKMNLELFQKCALSITSRAQQSASMLHARASLKHCPVVPGLLFAILQIFESRHLFLSSATGTFFTKQVLTDGVHLCKNVG